MSYKKIMPCLDIKGGSVVKGVKFLDVQQVADPVERAEYYCKCGADELVFYDIAASFEGRKIFTDLLKAVMAKTTVPLTVGGGISTIEDVDFMLGLGAAKVSINSGAIKNPEFIKEAADKFGSERIILSVDISLVDGKYMVFKSCGTENTGIDAIGWIKKLVEYGAGSIVVNSIDKDGVKDGFDIAMLKTVEAAVDVPLIASGGAGCIQDFVDLFKAVPNAEYGLAASVFHYNEVKIDELKKALHDNGIDVRV